MEAQDTELHCLILAAGDSQRLGKPKQLLRIENETLLHRICREAQSVSPHITVVLGAQAAEVTRAIDDLPVMRINNPDWHEGIASSLRAGVLSLPATADAVMVLLCDQATINAGHLQKLIDTWRQNPEAIVASAYNDILGVPVIFPRNEFSSLVSLAGDRGAQDLLLQEHVMSVELPAAACDIDTPADIEELRRQLNITIEMPTADAVSG